MKKTTFLFPFIFIVITSCGTVKKNVSDDYISKVSSYYTAHLPNPSDDASVFWDYILQNNPGFNQYESSNGKYKYKAKKAFWSEVNNIPLLYGGAENGDDEMRRALSFSGVKYKDYVKSVVICPDNIVDAYCYQNGNIYIHGGMVDMFDDELDAYCGIVAHEIAHILLKHAERHHYAVKKKERNDDIWRGITAGILVAGAYAGSMGMANSGVDGQSIENWTNSYTDGAMQLGSGINQALREHSLIKKFGYSREQEVEADIVAVLFLKWLGRSAEPYIELMSKFPNHKASLYDTHPNIKFRVSFLNKFIGKPDKSFEVGGLRYNVDGRQVEDFLRKNPTAKEVIN